jgi:hypothetical protein
VYSTLYHDVCLVLLEDQDTHKMLLLLFCNRNWEMSCDDDAMMTMTTTMRTKKEERHIDGRW